MEQSQMTTFQKLAIAFTMSVFFALLTTSFGSFLIMAYRQEAPTPLLALLSGVTSLAGYCTVMLPIAFLWDKEA